MIFTVLITLYKITVVNPKYFPVQAGVVFHCVASDLTIWDTFNLFFVISQIGNYHFIIKVGMDALLGAGLLFLAHAALSHTLTRRLLIYVSVHFLAFVFQVLYVCFFSQVQQLVIHRAFLSVLCHVLIFSPLPPFLFPQIFKKQTVFGTTVCSDYNSDCKSWQTG